MGQVERKIYLSFYKTDHIEFDFIRLDLVDLAFSILIFNLNFEYELDWI